MRSDNYYPNRGNKNESIRVKSNNGCLNFLAAFIILSIAIPSCLFRKELVQAQGERYFDQPKQERKLDLKKALRGD